MSRRRVRSQDVIVAILSLSSSHCVIFLFFFILLFSCHRHRYRAEIRAATLNLSKTVDDVHIQQGHVMCIPGEYIGKLILDWKISSKFEDRSIGTLRDVVFITPENSFSYLKTWSLGISLGISYICKKPYLEITSLILGQKVNYLWIPINQSIYYDSYWPDL